MITDKRLRLVAIGDDLYYPKDRPAWDKPLYQTYRVTNKRWRFTNAVEVLVVDMTNPTRRTVLTGNVWGWYIDEPTA